MEIVLDAVPLNVHRHAMNFNPSPLQAAIFAFIKDPEAGSAIVNAVAGSGKTTTIVKACELIQETQRVTFLAFNKKIATELQARLPKHVRAATFHSQGFNAWRRFVKAVETPDGNKCRNLVKRHFTPIESEAFGGIICKLVSVAKSAGVGSLVRDEIAVWQGLADHYDIALPEGEGMAERTLEAARRLLGLSVTAAMETPSVIDFDDMLYMPLLKNVPFFQNDWLFVDESQDTNAVQLALLRRMLTPSGRVVAVGDRRQAIYGFRGADATAMDNIKAAFNCRELPLTISYRCAQAVVRLAQTIVPAIEAAPTAPEGEVINAMPVDQAGFQNSDVIICRNTAPIVEMAYGLIGKGIGCKVLGREIGQALAQLINKMGVHDIDSLLGALDTFAGREIAKFMSKGQEQKAEAVRDKVDCIRAISNHLAETMRTVSALLAAIDRMFSDNTGADLLTLCTAHKSKGLEWNRVFIYRADLMPSKYARQAWQIEQEKNLQYVAWTRAKHTLVFLTDKPAPAPLPTVAPMRETARASALRRIASGELIVSPEIAEFWTTD